MSLNFPNASRAYDEKRHSVSFWGYDSAFEIAFHVEENALQRISPETKGDERSMLHAFDVNRARIEQVAGHAYAKGRSNYHRLSASDF
ncbi:Protein of unknown function [Rhizobiales bacterium GAS191]|jgi:hypothetical protein|nr:Protein of unknown function [Rhizobiales bacterium GAS113]SED75318.1 Protein of unknown function [Rhizobiales bacterium GAS191]SEE70286.1 Protein of unknown function [Rhizobiales bacterium GAS188]